MSAFDNIVSEAGAAETKAKGLWGTAMALCAGLAAKLPVRPTAKVLAATAEHGSVLATMAKTVMVLALMWFAYQVGGSEMREAYADERAAFAAYKTADAVALANDKQRQLDANVAITAAVRKNQDAADRHAADLQARIDSYDAYLRSRPADSRCTLSDDDINRLRDVARPHRRPAQPTRSGS